MSTFNISADEMIVTSNRVVNVRLSSKMICDFWVIIAIRSALVGMVSCSLTIIILGQLLFIQRITSQLAKEAWFVQMMKNLLTQRDLS